MIKPSCIPSFQRDKVVNFDTAESSSVCLYMIGESVPQSYTPFDGRQRCGMKGASLLDIISQHLIDDRASGRTMSVAVERDVPLHVIDEGCREPFWLENAS